MPRAVIFLFCLNLLSQSGCNRQDDDPQNISAPPAAKEEIIVTQPDYETLQKKITYGEATMAEMRQAFTNRDVLGLCNTIHALYSMRWHRGALNILDAMWALNRDQYPEFSWDLIENPSARIAVASTLSRIDPHNSDYLKYIRSQMDTEIDFNRAQVAVALGFNADPQDVPYLKANSEGDNVYVVQSAITGLALMNNVQARDALVELLKDNRNTAKGELISNVLKQAYSWAPETPPINPDEPQG